MYGNLYQLILHYYTTTLLHYYTTTLLHYYTTTLLHYYTTTQLHNYTTTQLHNYTTTLLHNNTTTQKKLLHNYKRILCTMFSFNDQLISLGFLLCKKSYKV